MDGSSGDGREGLTLVELTVSITIFTIIAVAVAFTITRGMQHRLQSFESYLAINAVRDILADIQETANRPQNLAKQEGIASIYAKYHNQTFPVANVPTASISVTCYADEATVPAFLGGPKDLNFDGDAQDNLGNQSNGTDLKLVPLTVTLTIGQGNMQQTLVRHRLISQTTN